MRRSLEFWDLFHKKRLGELIGKTVIVITDDFKNKFSVEGTLEDRGFSTDKNGRTKHNYWVQNEKGSGISLSDSYIKWIKDNKICVPD